MELMSNINNRTRVDVYMDRDTSWKGRHKQSHLGGRLCSYRHLQVKGKRNTYELKGRHKQSYLSESLCRYRHLELKSQTDSRTWASTYVDRDTNR